VEFLVKACEIDRASEERGGIAEATELQPGTKKLIVELRRRGSPKRDAP
jgi:hypothetical protein